MGRRNYGHLFYISIAVGALVASLALVSRPAMADGAIAIGKPADISKSGFTYGVGYSFSTSAGARAKALELCRKKESLASLCVVVSTFRSKCVSIAFDPQDGTPGVGWSIAKDEKTAEDQAIIKCEATAGRDRQGACRIHNTFCDKDSR